jgi:uncharacterized membrane protein YsdA (DUF1294 family)/cold shock CspA family protein
MRFEGIVKTWNDERGFGFIEPAQGGQEVFVHVKALARRGRRLDVNQRVTFEVELGPGGKKRARSVELVQAARARPASRSASTAQWGAATLFAIPAFLALYVVVGLLWRPPLLLAAVYAGTSVLTFLAYAQDKSAAQRNAWRMSESTLHGLALAGGWPGALLAQQLLRHKSAKAGFRSVFWVTVVLNVAAFVALCSPLGQAWRAAL